MKRHRSLVMSDYMRERVLAYRARLMREQRIDVTEAAVLRKLVELGLEQVEARS